MSVSPAAKYFKHVKPRFLFLKRVRGTFLLLLRWMGDAGSQTQPCIQLVNPHSSLWLRPIPQGTAAS